jgi:hypothetical protein
MIIYDSLITNIQDNNKHLWIKRAAGVDIYEFMNLYSGLWLSGSWMCKVTGPGTDLAMGLINRMKKLFQLN